MSEKFFSLDTNIIFGIVNENDRLHISSIELLNDNKKELLIIARNVKRESETTLLEKVNFIISQIIKHIPKYQNATSNTQLQAEIIESWRLIKEEYPDIENFINWVFDLILKNVVIEGIDNLFPFLSELGLKLQQSILIILVQLHPNAKIINAEPDKIREVRAALSEYNFKGNIDYKIFIDLVTNIENYCPIEFYTNDKDCNKNCIEGYEILVKKLDYDKKCFNSNLLNNDS